MLSKLVTRVVAAKRRLERFGAKDVTREIRERYGSRLDRKIDSRTIAAKLRRMARPERSTSSAKAGRFTRRCIRRARQGIGGSQERPREARNNVVSRVASLNAPNSSSVNRPRE